MKTISKVLIGVVLALALAGCSDIALRGIIADKVAAGVATIRVGSIANTRVGTGYTLDGSQMVTVRSKLLNPANFGPSGTVKKTISITDTAATYDSITTSMLSSFDVFFIGWVPNAPGFSAGEITAMKNWVSSGGVMIVTADDSLHNQVADLAFGEYSSLDLSSIGTDYMAPSGAGLTHPIFVGPFGTASAVYTSGLVGIMPFFGTSLGYDAVLGYYTAEELGYGSGKVIILSDVDFLSDTWASSGKGIQGLNGNDVFLGNVFAYAHR